jgi:integrase
MQNLVAEAGERAGLDLLEPLVKVTPQVLRHTYAYMLRQAGVSTRLCRFDGSQPAYRAGLGTGA